MTYRESECVLDRTVVLIPWMWSYVHTVLLDEDEVIRASQDLCNMLEDKDVSDADVERRAEEIQADLREAFEKPADDVDRKILWIDWWNPSRVVASVVRRMTAAGVVCVYAKEDTVDHFGSPEARPRPFTKYPETGVKPVDEE